MTTVRAWLPPNAITGQGIDAKIQTAVGAWAERWFAELRVTVRLASQPAGVKLVEGWRRFGETTSIRCSAMASGRLVNAALDARTEGLDLTAADRQLLERFELRLLGDLALQVETALGVATLADDAKDPSTDGGALQVTVTDAGSDAFLVLTVPTRTVVASRMAALGPRQTRPARLVPLVQAAGPTPIVIRARLGQVQAPLRELGGLAQGDVLVLDNTLQGGLDLLIAETGMALARATLTEADGQVALTVHA